MTEAAQTLPSTSPDSTPARSKGSRNYLKCQRCRGDRKACDFYADSTICVRCIGLGHACSGPRRAERKSNRKADESSGRMVRATEGSIIVGGTTTTMSDFDRTMIERDPNHGYISYGMTLKVVTQRLYTMMRSDLEKSMAFEDASDILLTYKKSQTLLNHILVQCEILQDQSMTNNHGFHPHHSSENSDLVEMVPIMVDRRSGENIVVLCTANILKRYKPMATTASTYAHNMHKELPGEYYIHAARAINQLLRTIPQDSSEEWLAYNQQFKTASKHDYFPAWAIAWMNLDFENAQRLWSDTVIREGRVVDVLGRTFLHLAAESGDPRPMEQIDRSFLAGAGRDGRDLTLLDLAVIGDSASMVTKIIDEEIVLPPYTRAMQRAIRGKRLRLARNILLDRLFQTDKIELRSLADLAYHNGYTELSRELKKIKLCQATQEATLAALEIPITSFSTQYDSEFNMSPDLQYTEQYFQAPLDSFDTWDSFDDQGDTQNQSSQDPGGGSYSHDPDAPFAPPWL